VDTGGTFTDCLAVDPEGRRHRAKVLSSSALRGRVAAVVGPRAVRFEAPWRVPVDFFRGGFFRSLGDEGLGVRVEASTADQVTLAEDLAVQPGDAFEIGLDEEAPILAARLITGTAAGVPLPPMALRLATTRGTNALLERRGAPTALFLTEGFADLLVIGTQQRPDLFALEIRRDPPLYTTVVEVAERLAADGSVVRPLDLEALREPVRRLRQAGVEGAAVALLHSYRNGDHEARVVAFLRAAGFRHIAASAELAAAMGFLPRAETAVVDAYLSPVIRQYLDRVAGALGPESTLHGMTSAGGLVRAAEFQAKDSLLSGPAGGVVGAAGAGRASGYQKVLALDMGGTSTDVARCDGDFEYRFEFQVGGVHLMAPALVIETVAAGGGSLCTFDGSQLKVGPESAGATPGPACYGAGGPLTLTDVNLLLGRLDAARFEIPIDPEAARSALAEIRRAVEAASGEATTDEELLAGFLTIADERMADAVSTISVRRGYDPADYALVAFGGAGAQHAAPVAELLGIQTVLVPENAAVLSAAGLEAAVVERFAQRQVLAPLAAVEDSVGKWLDTLATEAVAAVASEGIPAERVEVRRRLAALRFAGQDTTVLVDATGDLKEAFAVAYRELYGYQPEAREIEVESLRVVASSRAPTLFSPTDPAVPGDRPDDGAAARVHPGGVRPRACPRCYLGGHWREVPAYERDALPVGEPFSGPALVFERHTAVVVPPGWGGRLDAVGTLVLERAPLAPLPPRG
jgi:5-oxoprolinase (ATP-hydrolysing)